ncbi:ribosomal protein L28e [Marasmius fiardii PR-910]|nr:ribosomal protein L28e [Marasmius fiardii PR-910]
MSNDLQWLLLRNYNSYMVKGLPEGPIFSKEPGNLVNIHSHKYSGLSNSKTIDVSDVNGTIQITTRKTKVSPQTVAAVRSTSNIRARSGVRRGLRVASATAKRGYRPDLRRATLARVSCLITAQKEPKPQPAKKTRGKKAKNSA